MPSKKKLLVNFVLDETGSMFSVKDATISGFNEYIGELKRRGENILFSLTQFNSEKVAVVHQSVPIADVPDLNADTYQPGYTTPLYDAVARTIKATDESVAAMKGKPNVLCVIQTDGLENASREYNLESVRKLIEEKTAAGWTFAFLGADQDAWVVGQSIGVPVASTMAYAGTPDGTKDAFAATATATARYAASGGAQSRSFYGGRKDIRKK